MKKKILVLMLLGLMFTLTGCLIQDHIMVDVGQGLKNIVEHDSYSVETEIYLNSPEETRDENAEPNGKYVVTVDGDAKKYELVLGTFSYTYYTYIDEYGYEKIIFNANPFDPAQGTLWLSSYTGSYGEEDNFDYLLDINPEFFDLEDDVYTLNEAGKADFKNFIENIIGSNEYLSINFNEQSTTKIYVDTEHVNQIKTNMMLLDFVNQEKIYQADLEISFTRLNQAVVVLPEDVTTVEEFIYMVEISIENGIQEFRQAIIDSVQQLGDNFVDQLLNAEKEAMKQFKLILQEILGESNALVNMLEQYLGELGQYVEIEGILMNMLESVLEQYKGELENIDDILDALQAELEAELNMVLELFNDLVVEYEDEIYNAIIEKILELLGL